MTNGNNRGQTTVDAVGVSVAQGAPAISTEGLPDDYQVLVAQKVAIEAKIETVVVPAMRERWQREAAELGKTPEEVLGFAGKTRRGRKPKQKSEE